MLHSIKQRAFFYSPGDNISKIKRMGYYQWLLRPYDLVRSGPTKAQLMQNRDSTSYLRVGAPKEQPLAENCA